MLQKEPEEPGFPDLWQGFLFSSSYCKALKWQLPQLAGSYQATSLAIQTPSFPQRIYQLENHFLIFPGCYQEDRSTGARTGEREAAGIFPEPINKIL